MLKLLTPVFDRIYFTSYSRSGRSATREELLRTSSQSDIDYYARPVDAWNAARAVAQTDDMIVITGSVFLAGELREFAMQLS